MQNMNMAFCTEAISSTEVPLEIAAQEAEFPPKYPMSWQRCTFKDVHHSIAFIIGENWQPPKCPSIGAGELKWDVSI